MEKIKHALRLAKECTYADEMTEGAKEFLRREITIALDRIKSLDAELYQKQKDLITTVHHNACTNTIASCIKEWDVNPIAVTHPPHPPIDKIKKQ